MKEKDFILEHDYCFYFDVDMAIHQVVGDEILGDLVATNHFYQSRMDDASKSFDRNSKSLAFVPYGEKARSYYAGGFNGGKTEVFMDMAKTISFRVDKDLEAGIVAQWHDESHMNRYMIDHPPSRPLSYEYCYPEPELGRHPNDNPKIIALLKNHGELRS